MTKQRFTFGYIDGVKLLMDNGKFVPDNIALKLLNKLHDECEFLETENEALEHATTKYAELSHKSLKENEQLKQTLRIYRKVANCSNCEYHNYDWYDDGDEFEVCDKGNDVTEGICKDWREL